MVRTLPQGKDGIGLFCAGGNNTAWAMILKTARDGAHTVSQQSRSDRITGKTRHGFAIECKLQRAVAIDSPAGGQPIFHDFSACKAAAGLGAPI